VQQRSEEGRPHAQAVITLIETMQLGKRSIGLTRQCGEPVEKGELALSNGFIRGRYGASHIPRQHLYFVERRDIAHESSGDKPQSSQVRKADAKFRCVGLTSSAPHPRLPRDQKAVSRDVKNVEIDV
jgi:hypothetical protein